MGKIIGTLSEENFKLMTKEQKLFVMRQWVVHQHDDIKVDFDISGFGDRILSGFSIRKGVWDPFKASGGRIARFLVNNTRLFRDKDVLDLGSGTGLLGIVMALHGARHVVLSDVSTQAVGNTEENIHRFDVESICEARQSDLFERIPEKFDTILWNIPFFPGYPPEGDSIAISMMMPPDLLKRFLKESREHLKEGGVVVIPSFVYKGPLMFPLFIGEFLGYTGTRSWTFESKSGIQQGRLYITELRL